VPSPTRDGRTSAGARSSRAPPTPASRAATTSPWEGRAEDKADEAVWAVTCIFTRVGFRKRGVGRALARAAVEFAREPGARAVEAYPMVSKDVIVEELHVGTLGMFAAAGLTEVSRPTLRRVEVVSPDARVAALAAARGLALEELA
jgi:GNAT superfamily N-acetyltransferase